MTQQFDNTTGSKPISVEDSRQRLQKLINRADSHDPEAASKIKSRVIARQQSTEPPSVVQPVAAQGLGMWKYEASASQSEEVDPAQPVPQAPVVQAQVPNVSNAAPVSNSDNNVQSQAKPVVAEKPVATVKSVETAKPVVTENLVATEKAVVAEKSVIAEKAAVAQAEEKLEEILKEEEEDSKAAEQILLEPEYGQLSPDSSGYWQKAWEFFVKDGEISHTTDDKILLEVSVPHANEVEISSAEQVFSGLVSVGKKQGGFFETMVGILPQTEILFKNPESAVSFEIIANQKHIKFWLVIHKKDLDVVQRQIQGVYQDADIEKVTEAQFFGNEGAISVVEIKPKGKVFYPIRHSEEFTTDPLNTITSSISNLTAEERVIIQYLIQPSDNIWRKNGQAFVNSAQPVPADGKKKRTVDPKIVEAVSQKISKPGFRVALRIIVQAPDAYRAQLLAQNIARAYDQFSVPNMTTIKESKVTLDKVAVERMITRTFPHKGNYPVFNTLELATMYHLPNKSVDTPRIKWLRFRNQPPPENVPTEGLYMGYSDFRGSRTPIYISRKDRRRHMYLIGQTGTGKSVWLKTYAQQDILNGDGLAFIDPHGDAVMDLLEMIPKERAEDVIYFDPSDIERPFGLNILEAKTEEAKHMIVNSFIGLLYKLYSADTIGPQLERTVRNVMLTAMSEKGNSMIEVMKLIIDPKFIETKLHLIDDPMVKSYWVDQMASTTESTRSEQLGYFVSKFDRFVTEKVMRNIIGQSKSSFDFRKAMDERKILLVNLSKGQIGEENSKFLGLLLVPRILAAAMSRVDTPEDERKDFYLYVDEFQNFATSDFVQILSEARKYKLCLTVANQFISQMQEDIRDAVFGNVGTIVGLRVGQDDADYLEKQLEPTFKASDMVNLTMGQAVSRLLINGHPSTPFSFKSDYSRYLELPRNPKIGEVIKEISRLKYGRDRRIVESEIATRAGFV